MSLQLFASSRPTAGPGTHPARSAADRDAGLTNDDPQEHELEDRQGKLYPVGRALRRTFDAENHDSLGTDLTGLMLELARIDPEAPAPGRGAMPLPTPPDPPPALPVETASPSTSPAQSWWRAVVGRLLA